MNRAPLITAIVLLLLPLLYVGSYLALVVPQGRGVFMPGSGRMGFTCHYRIDGETIAPAFFWPLEQIDRKLRPGVWVVWRDAVNP